MKKLVIFGTGDVGQLAHFYFTHDTQREVVAFCSDGAFIDSKTYQGLPVVPFETILETHPPDAFDMFVALSYRNVNKVRAEKYDAVKQKGYHLPSYVCSKSVLWDDARIGENCFIFENQTIQPFVTIGNNVTMWSGNHIGHHSIIGDHVFITSHVVVSGHVEIGSHCFLGVNSTLTDGIKLAPRTVVGAGATVIKNTVEEGVYRGPVAELRAVSSSKLRYFTKTRYEDRK
jgi:sugar O-acyltransferase (sialic acid O-acetyltransferase NeuD family)